MSDLGPPHRQLPALERDTRFFWTAGAAGTLLINRCDSCGRYQHPPLPNCPACGSDAINAAPVSGQGRIASFTINHQAWLPRLAVPYVFAVIELIEQAELYVFTNIIDCSVEQVHIGMPVEVRFEQHDDVYLPMFRPTRPT